MGNYIKRTCPVCDLVERRFEKGLCQDCKNLISEAKANREWIKLTDKVKPYKIPKFASDLPYIPKCSWSDKYEPFQTAFHNLLKLLGEPINGTTSGEINVLIDNGSNSGSCEKNIIALQPAIRDALNIIYQEVLSIANDTYKAGFRDGSNLIERLANGSITIDKLNEITAKL